MTRLRHILFPYDFSKQGRQVVPFVKALATQSSARLTLFSVVPPAFDAMPSDMDPALRRGDDTGEWIRRLRERLEQALVDEFAGLCVERIAECGDPALRITHFAETHDVDLIMMPTHGLGTFRNLLVGSVTSKVLHDSKCPVWTAAHAETQKAPELPRKLLCALDGSVATAGLAKWAADFSAHVGASLNFVHVVESVSDMPWLASEQRLQDKLRADARDKILLAFNLAGVEAPLRIAVGSIVQTVTEDARQESADMVIVGRGSVGEPFGRLRTHALAIIQRAPCPVLSV